MHNKPFVEKLGYVPQAEVLKFVTADQKMFVADSLVMKTLFYFGSLVEKSTAKFILPPDYFSIYKTIETAVKLDPYNMDAYYFAQAVMVWDAKRVKEANCPPGVRDEIPGLGLSAPLFPRLQLRLFSQGLPQCGQVLQKGSRSER